MLAGTSGLLTGAGITGFLVVLLYIAYLAVRTHRVGVDQSRNQNYEEIRGLMQTYKDELAQTRAILEDVRARVIQLEDYIRSHGLSPPPPDKE